MTCVNALFVGDNLQTLRGFDDAGKPYIPPASVDLVYLDPPFNSGRDYSTNRKIGSAASGTVAFGDKFRWDAKAIDGYDAVIRDASPGLRFSMQALHVAYPKSPLLSYCVFIAPRLAALHRSLKPTGYLWLHCDDSAMFALAVILDGIFEPGPRSRKIVWKRSSAHGNVTRAYGRIHDTLLFYPMERFYRRNARPKHIPTIWDDIAPLNNSAKERTGYPTQKPVALLKRIVGLSSKPGDVVLDPFVGSGTTIVAAHEMGRRWIGMDHSPLAADVVRGRLAGVDFRVVEPSNASRQLAPPLISERSIA